MLTLSLIAIAAVLGLVYIGFNAPNKIPGRSYYTVQAAFNNADNITGHYQVRLNGRLVGQVLDPRIEDGKAVVDLQLEPDVRPLLSDSKIEVRPRSAVGVRYVDITSGTKGAPLDDGGRIPASQTSSTVQLDDVLGTFDTDTQVRARQFMRELGTGFAGRGEDLNEVQGEARPFLEDATSVMGTIADREGSMKSLIRGGGTLADALDPVRVQMGEGFAPEAKALRPFVDRKENLQKTLEVAPGALSSVRSDLTRVDPFISEVRGFARAVRPALTAAPSSLRQTSALLREARPGLRAADDTLRTAGRAVAPTLKLLAAIRPVLPNVESTLANATPIVASLGRHGCDFAAMGENWGTMLASGNADGGVLRFFLIPGAEEAYGQKKKSTRQQTRAYPEPCTVGSDNDRLGR